MRNIRVAAGIVRQQDLLLLVEQVVDGLRYWSLPGGVVEDGESLHSGLQRELSEESGICARRFGALAHVTELCMPDFISTAHVFEVDDWIDDHSHHPLDPAGEVVKAQFFLLDEALDRLAALPWSFMSEPITEYFNGTGRTFYSYSARGKTGNPANARRAELRSPL